MSDVPCNGCTACCRQQVVLLSEEDEPNMGIYDYRLIGDLRVLNNKPNGECTHLGREGCTIYQSRPFICRTYDCRKHLESLAGRERRLFLDSAVGNEARKRLGTLDADDLADLPNDRSSSV